MILTYTYSDMIDITDSQYLLWVIGCRG